MYVGMLDMGDVAVKKWFLIIQGGYGNTDKLDALGPQWLNMIDPSVCGI